jgi:lipopolysaccharide/colanic/teichoic acid biosynthesis glycosyltransferase
VIVDDGATVDQSILLDRTYVGHLVNIKEAVVHGATIINSASAEHTHVTDSFLLSRIEATTAPPGRTWQVLNQACALFLIIAVLPLILPLALAVYITSGFRLLHRSAHLGKILKNAEGNGDKELSFETFDLFSFQTRQRNGAYTILGGWMEALDLHRLPELLNVLRGDIHMIGVKPLMPNDTSYLMEEWHQRRNECVPGFTGLWYIQTDPGSDFDTILVNDVYYSATRTWQGDIRILFRTPGAWLRRYRLSSQAKRTPAQDHSTQTHTTLSSKN